MLKGLVNLFKCCKSQNRQNRETQETQNYRETEKNQNENINKNFKGFSSQKTLSTKNTIENMQTPNAGEKSPQTIINKTEIDIGNFNDHYQTNLKNEKEQIKNNQEIDLVQAVIQRNDDNNDKQQNEISDYASNQNLIEIPKECVEGKDQAESIDEYKVRDEIEQDFDKIIVPDKYIREEEKNCLIWSKNGILEFIDKITNLDEYTEIKTKEEGLDIRIRKAGSELNKSIYIVKGVYKVAKKEFAEGVSMEFMKDLIYEPELRISWDDGYKEFKKLEGNREVYAIRSWLKSPMFIISERDAIDKRIEFFKGKTYYNFASSLDDSFFPEEKGVVRCKNYFNIFTASQDDEFYYFTSINQSDIKVKNI